MYTDTCIQIHTCTHPYTYMHRHIHSYTYMHISIHAHAHINTCMDTYNMHTGTCQHIHTCTQSYTHTCPNTHMLSTAKPWNCCCVCRGHTGLPLPHALLMAHETSTDFMICQQKIHSATVALQDLESGCGSSRGSEIASFISCVLTEVSVWVGEARMVNLCPCSKIKDLSQGMPDANWAAQHTALSVGLGCTGTNVSDASCWLPLASLCC